MRASIHDLYNVVASMLLQLPFLAVVVRYKECLVCCKPDASAEAAPCVLQPGWNLLLLCFGGDLLLLCPGRHHVEVLSAASRSFDSIVESIQPATHRFGHVLDVDKFALSTA